MQKEIQCMQDIFPNLSDDWNDPAHRLARKNNLISGH